MNLRRDARLHRLLAFGLGVMLLATGATLVYEWQTRPIPADVDPLWQALRGRARLVANGHEHNLPRLRPIDGITELIAGAGGQSRDDLDEDDHRLAFARDDTDGAQRLELSPGAAQYRFVSAAGEVLDSGTIRCAA